MKVFIETAEKYALVPDKGSTDAAGRCLVDCSIVFVSGLLFQAFKSATNKSSLRLDIGRALKVLAENNVERKWLPPALLARAESALAFQIAV